MPDSQSSSLETLPLVLLVEDNDVNRYTVARMLRKAGFSVAEAASGAQAMEELRTNNVAVVVCDVDLPDVNGFELCRRIKSDPQTASIPFLQMSASFTSSQDQVQGLEGGADGYLVQPFEIPVLAATIRAMLRVRVAEEQARSLSRQWETTFSSIRDAIVVTDPQGNITRCNAAFGDLFNSIPEALEDCSVFALNEPSLQFSEESLLHSPQSPQEVQIGVQWFRVQRDLICDERGVASEIIQILSDNTTQVLARQEAETANRLKDEFLATLSHELRTPLTSILGWIEILIDGGLDEATSIRALESIQRNAQAQHQLIEDILDVSRIMSGKLAFTPHEFDLALSIEGAVNVVRPAASAKGIRLTIDLQPDVGLILGDSNRLQQVMWNLLSNSIKFTPQGGRVSISLDRVDSYAQVTVADTGKGIDATFLPHVFDRFRQADSSSTRSYNGLGLGLAIVRQLVEMHGGSIEAFSQGLGQGSHFIVRFPLMASPVAQSEEGVPSITKNPGNEAVSATTAFLEGVTPQVRGKLAGVHILVVDDEPDARTLIGVVLQRAGASVSLAASVAEAWEILHQEPAPQAIVSDIGMPGEDGYSFIRRLRRAESENNRSSLPAVALTAFARSDDKTRAFTEGFDAYQSKPLEAKRLINTLEDLLTRSSNPSIKKDGPHTTRT